MTGCTGNSSPGVRSWCTTSAMASHVWPKDKPFVAYEPPAPASAPRWLARAVDLSIVAVLALIGWGLYELLLR